MTSAKKHPSAYRSKQLDDLQKHFDVWRKSHKPRTRIPIPLWKAAVQVAGQYGLHRTARTLHLDYYALKKRLEEDGSKQTAVPFIELSPAVSVPVPECVIELEKRDGAILRFHLKGMGMPDLNTLSDAFWRNKL